jgi:SAM-dependent methyltransferase
MASAERLYNGELLMVWDNYGRGADVLDALHDYMQPPPFGADHELKSRYELAYRKAAKNLLVGIRGHKVMLNDGAPIGFLEQLYPDLPQFVLPFVEMQELFGAWRRFVDGVPMPVLGHKLHPYFGTYAPTRTSHLQLFATWLSQYKGSKARAIDVGCGSGVLSLMLAKAGVEQVLAIDDNPNAVHSVALEIERHPPRGLVIPAHGDLLEPNQTKADLIVFNPPWTQQIPSSLVDRALYFPKGLFERFFDQAEQHLAPGGRVVLLFSNLITLVQPEVPHPIESELRKGRFSLVQTMNRKVKSTKSKSGKARGTKEKVQVWELERACP